MARLTYLVINSLFFIWPSLIAGIAFYLLEHKYGISLNTEKREIEATCSATWVGFGFAAAVFLLGINKSESLKKLEKKGLFYKYATVIILPVLTGNLHLFTLVISSNDRVLLLEISKILFYITLFQSFWSIVILFFIAKKSRIDI